MVVDGETYTTTVADDGTWAVEVGPLTAGEYTIEATQSVDGEDPTTDSVTFSLAAEEDAAADPDADSDSDAEAGAEADAATSGSTTEADASASASASASESATANASAAASGDGDGSLSHTGGALQLWYVLALVMLLGTGATLLMRNRFKAKTQAEISQE